MWPEGHRRHPVAAACTGFGRPRRAAAVLCLAVVAAGLAAAGCTQLLSIEEDALVVGAALDAGARAGTVDVTLQWYYVSSPAGAAGAGGGAAGTSGGSGGGSTLRTLSGSGPSVALAVRGVQSATDQSVDFLVTQLVVVGDGLARAGVDAPLDYFWRNPDFSETAMVAVARGRAAAVLGAPVPGGAAFSLYHRLQVAERSNTGSIPIPIWRFLSQAADPYAAAWAPLVAATPDGDRAVGTAIFRGDRLVDELGPAETGVLSWLLKRGGYADLTVPAAALPPRLRTGGPVTFRVRAVRVRRRVTDADHALLDVRLRLQIRQGWGLHLSTNEAGGAEAALEAAAARQGRRELEALVRRLQADGSDVLGFGLRMHARDPRAARDWPARFRRLHLTVRLSAGLVPAGRET